MRGLPVAVSGPGRLAVLAAAVAARALLSPASPLLAHEPKDRETLEWSIEPSHARLGPDDKLCYLRLRLGAQKIPAPDRQPLSLALVFDRSGSMGEDAKIGYLRQAAHLVVDNLTPEDQTAFIAYNDKVQTLAPLQRAVNREYLHHRVEELHAEGYTNLSAGLLEGCAQLERNIGEPGRHHLVLLTDGLANRGVTDPGKLAGLAAGCAERGITVTTIGVGTEYDEVLLARMAQAGRGRYVYVAKPEQIPEVLRQELGALLAVVAQNVKVRLELPPGLEVEQIFGSEEPGTAGTRDVPLGDLASGEERVLLAKVRVSPAAPSTGPIPLRALLSYDAIAEARRVEAQRTLTIDRGKAAAATGADGPSESLLAYAALVEAVEKVELAVRSMDRDFAGEVSEIRKRDYPRLRAAALAQDDQEFVNKAFLFEHFSRELEELIREGALHEHSEARARLQKELHYRRYLGEHHKPPH